MADPDIPGGADTPAPADDLRSTLEAAFAADAEISFGGKVYKSVLINFIEERAYVDFITDVEMCHYATDGTIIQLDNDEIIASTAKLQ